MIGRTRKLRNRRKLLKKKILKSSSIEYAKRIQDAVMPSMDGFIDRPNCFVFYRPKELFLGILLVCQNGDEAFIAAVDCTGHGVQSVYEHDR